MQTELWSAVKDPALTQAAWWSCIPKAAWGLMVFIAICANVMSSYGRKSRQGGAILLLILPLVLSIIILLMADIDSSRGGFIYLYAQNLQGLAESLVPH